MAVKGCVLKEWKTNITSLGTLGFVCLVKQTLEEEWGMPVAQVGKEETLPVIRIKSTLTITSKLSPPPSAPSNSREYGCATVSNLGRPLANSLECSIRRSVTTLLF